MYKIVIDSCGELPEELKQDGHYETVSWKWTDAVSKMTALLISQTF